MATFRDRLHGGIELDNVYCLVESTELPFAVASFYEDFHDLTDEEVIEYVEDLRRENLLWMEEE